jgi:hypothetical protein
VAARNTFLRRAASAAGEIASRDPFRGKHESESGRLDSAGDTAAKGATAALPGVS